MALLLKDKLALLLFIVFSFFSSNVWAGDTAKFIAVSDVHFSPFADCPYLKKHCHIIDELRKADYKKWEIILERFGNKKVSMPYENTNYALLKSMMLKLHEIHQKEKPLFVVNLGDFLGHNFREYYVLYTGDKSDRNYQEFVKKTLEFISYQFSKEFSDIDVYSVVGNNDSYNYDYHAVPRSLFFSDAADIWSALIRDKTNKENLKNEFPNAGYYHVFPAGDQHHRIIIMNSVLFSHYANSEAIKQASSQELAWIKNQLQQARDQHQQVWILEHIPIGIDAVATMEIKLKHLVPLWRPESSHELIDILNRLPAVTAVLAGHLHTETFRFFTVKSLGAVPVYIVPSISPIYGNNPGFKIFSYDTTSFQLTDVSSYYYPLDQIGAGQWVARS